MLSDKQARAKEQGYTARTNGVKMSDNPYLYLPKYKHLAGFYDAGWIEADKKLNESELK